MMYVMVATLTSGKRERREVGDIPAAMFPVKGPTKDGKAGVARGATNGMAGDEDAGAVDVVTMWFS
jgi:hypothetical protein